MTAGERIYKCRKAKKLSQEYVATILGVSRQAVSKWENDLSVPDTVNYINLAKIFGVSVEYLAFGEGDGPSGEKIILAMLLFAIGCTVILVSLLMLNSFLIFMIGVLAIVLAKKIGMD